MTPESQTAHFANDLERLINRYRDEYDMTYSNMVGVLHIQTHLLCREMADRHIPPQSQDTDDLN
jgi:hypothetical protein